MRPNPLMPSVRCTPIADVPSVRSALRVRRAAAAAFALRTARPILRHAPVGPELPSGCDGPALQDGKTRGRRRPRQGIIGATVRTSPVPFDSDALRANIASTAQKVVIPDRYLPLAGRGARVCTACAPRSPRPWASTSTPSATPTCSSRASRRPSCATGPTSSVPRTARGCSGSSRSWSLGLLEAPLSDEQFSLLLRGLLQWCTEALRGPYGAGVRRHPRDDRRVAGPPAARAACRPSSSATSLLAQPGRARRPSGPAPAPVFLELYRRVLLGGYRRVEERLDVPGWALAQGEGLTDPGGRRRALRLPPAGTRRRR